MALVRVNGTVTVPKSGSAKLVFLWELFDLANGTQAKRKWVVWTQALPTDLVEGSWIEVQGDFGHGTSYIDGVLQTYQNKKGDTISNCDLALNNVEVLQVKPKDNPVPAGVDLDDERKYGRLLTDDNPF